jgi:hypothetical protein
MLQRYSVLSVRQFFLRRSHFLGCIIRENIRAISFGVFHD